MNDDEKKYFTDFLRLVFLNHISLFFDSGRLSVETLVMNFSFSFLKNNMEYFT